MKTLALAAAMSISSAAPMPTQTYEVDESTRIIITIQSEQSSGTALLGCFPLIPTHDAK